MSADTAALSAHLKTGLTTVCRCWAILRPDGVQLGFTDHDMPLEFDGMIYEASAGLSASAIQQTTGLSVDNTEAVGALSHAALQEAELLAGRYDGAEVQIWLVNWADVSQRELQFKGRFGEIQEVDGAFRAEIRGLTEALNQPQGQVFQKDCTAVLGDKRCSVDLATPGFSTEAPVLSQIDGRIFSFAPFETFALHWFERGTLRVLSGKAEGLIALIKNDRWHEDRREIEVWEGIRAEIQPGDLIRLEAGCDKRSETCRLKFQNLLNFQGFPHIPGDDWLISYPVKGGQNDGGSLS